MCARYIEVENKWWDQRSTASSQGCSNATDSTGYYIYRKNGKRDGACFGMDLDLAKKDYDGAGSCKTNSTACQLHRLDPCVPFAIVCLGFVLERLNLLPGI